MFSVAIRVHFECPHCAQQVIVGGVSERVTCDHCLETIPITGPLRWHVNHFVLRRALEVGKTRTAGLGGQAEVQMQTTPVLCAHCEAPFESAAILATSSAPSIACPACHATMAMRPIPAGFMPDMPLRGVLVGEQLDAAAPAEAAAAAHPVVMACMSCGGSLRIDGKERMVDCPFCQASNYLPDPVWARLHPARKLVTFYLVAEQQ